MDERDEELDDGDDDGVDQDGLDAEADADDDDAYDRCAYLDRLVAIMRRHGWATRCVEGAAGRPPRAYTVGLFEHDAPELIVFGLHPLAADDLLGRIAQRARGGTRFAHGQILDDVYPGHPDYPYMLLDVADTGEHLPDAYGFIEPRPPGEQRLRAWQVVYPDRDGRWPWDHGSRVAYLPLLGLIPEGV